MVNLSLNKNNKKMYYCAKKHMTYTVCLTKMWLEDGCSTAGVKPNLNQHRGESSELWSLMGGCCWDGDGSRNTVHFLPIWKVTTLCLNFYKLCELWKIVSIFLSLHSVTRGCKTFTSTIAVKRLRPGTCLIKDGVLVLVVEGGLWHW